MGAFVPDIDNLLYYLPSDELSWDRWHRQEAINFAIHNWSQEIKLLRNKLIFFLVTDTTHHISRKLIVWVPSLIALCSGLIYWYLLKGQNTKANTIWMVFGMQLIISLVYYVNPRYRMAVDFVPIILFCGFIHHMLGIWWKDCQFFCWWNNEPSDKTRNQPVDGLVHN